MDKRDELELQDRRSREDAAKRVALRTQKSVTYKDTDGCEVTATPSGHVFYNAADWW